MKFSSQDTNVALVVVILTIQTSGLQIWKGALPKILPCVPLGATPPPFNILLTVLSIQNIGQVEKSWWPSQAKGKGIPMDRDMFGIVNRTWASIGIDEDSWLASFPIE